MKHALTLLAALFVALPLSAMAVSLDLINDPATGGPGKIAAEEIRREAKAGGMTLGEEASVTRVVLTIKKGGNAVAQSYSIRLRNEDGRRTITLRGTDATGAMYGGLDVAEALRMATLDRLKDSDHRPHIERRGIKFNIPLDVRTPSDSDNCTSAQANIPEMWSMDFRHKLLDPHGAGSLQCAHALEPSSVPFDRESAGVSQRGARMVRAWKPGTPPRPAKGTK